MIVSMHTFYNSSEWFSIRMFQTPEANYLTIFMEIKSNHEYQWLWLLILLQALYYFYDYMHHTPAAMKLRCVGV